MSEAAVDVVVQIGGVDLDAGTLWSHRRRKAESATFAYRADYLAHPDAYELDPSLPLVAGAQQTPGEQAMFGAFSDCAPDRWGRRLIERDEQLRVERAGGAGRSFGEMDFLVGARDDARQGAIRLRDQKTGAFLAPPPRGVPPLVELPALLDAAERLDRDEATHEELRLLLRGGSSLGGARPKAHVIDGGGKLAIAKFPSPAHDEWEVIRWEAVAVTLARDAGIEVPRAELHLIDGKPVLVLERFDRDGDWRIGYASAMTMLELSDRDQGSYLDIAAAIEERSPRARTDLHELWRRIAFGVLISNSDDHLRNHGFLRTSSSGWRLAPAFDLNPDPRPGRVTLSTSIDETDPTASIDLAMRVAPLFRLGDSEARQIVGEVTAAVSRWREAAQRAGIASAEIDRMAPAFERSGARLEEPRS
jgi:serine/threonine-protein kinase HipA